MDTYGTQVSNIHRLNESLKKCEALLNERSPEFLQAAENAINAAKDVSDELALVSIYKLIHQYHQQVTNDHQKGAEACKLALEKLERHNDYSLQVELLHAQGLHYRMLGQLPNMRSCFLKAMNLLQKRKNIFGIKPEVEAGIHYELGVFYMKVELRELAYRHAGIAFDLFSRNQHKEGIAKSNLILGVLDLYNGQREKALTYLQEALRLYEELNQPQGVGLCHNNIGQSYYDQKLFDQALEHYRIGKSILKTANPVFHCLTCISVGKTLLELEQFDAAEKSLQEAESEMKRLNTSLYNEALFESYVKLYERQKDYEKAFYYQKKHYDESHNIFELSRDSQSNDTMLLAELEDLKKENELLIERKEELNDYAQQLFSSNNELREFAHVASHDMREPLRMISMYLQLIEKEESITDNPKLNEYLHFARQGALRMMDMITSMLNLSKINADFEWQEVNAAETLKEVLASFQEELDSRKAEVQIAELPVLYAERNYLFQIFQNLIGNALKYNHSEPPRIKIDYFSNETTHLFSVADNGIGIHIQYRSKVFDMFQRLHTREEYSGSGIGLSLCKKMVNRMSGNIWIEDSPLGGSKFCFTIRRIS